MIVIYIAKRLSRAKFNGNSVVMVTVCASTFSYKKSSENRSPYHLDITSSNRDDAIAIHDQEPKTAKLAMLSGWEGCHTLLPLSITETLANLGCMYAEVDG